MQQVKVNNLNTVGGEIIEQSSSQPDAKVLKEKLDALNKRWEIVCIEIADRKDRYYMYSYCLSKS